MRILYKITNLINGKCYIGQTKDYDKRMLVHIKYGNNYSLVHKAIKKYGVDSFMFERLAILEDRLIDETEVKAIKIFNSLNHRVNNISVIRIERVSSGYS